MTWFFTTFLSMAIYLQRCVECDGSSATCDTRPGSMDGNGVADADIIIYVGASLFGGICSPTSGVIAFASTCQLENTLDRYEQSLS